MKHREFKVGDRVVMRGVVTTVSESEDEFYQMHCDFNGQTLCFRKDGTYGTIPTNPQVEHDNYKRFPRVMLVNVTGYGWVPRVVVGIINNNAYTIDRVECIEDITGLECANPWPEYKEIQEQFIELTLQDISDGKGVGVDPKLIKIKAI